MENLLVIKQLFSNTFFNEKFIDTHTQWELSDNASREKKFNTHAIRSIMRDFSKIIDPFIKNYNEGIVTDKECDVMLEFLRFITMSQENMLKIFTDFLFINTSNGKLSEHSINDVYICFDLIKETLELLQKEKINRLKSRLMLH